MHWCPILPSVCFGLSFLCTCVSVRRRDRCTRTPLIRFAVSCLVLLHAPPPSSVFSSLLALLRSSALCSSLALSVLPSFSLAVLCAPVCVALPWDCAVLVLLLFRLVFWFFALLAVLVRALLFPLLSALLCCGSCLCPVCLPSPASGLVCALVQLAPWCAGTSLWVSGCSCDGSVALLSCWECG